MLIEDREMLVRVRAQTQQQMEQAYAGWQQARGAMALLDFIENQIRVNEEGPAGCDECPDSAPQPREMTVTQLGELLGGEADQPVPVGDAA